MTPTEFEYGESPSTAPERPGVWACFVVYCVIMALLYAFLAVAGGVLLSVDPVDVDMERAEQVMVGGMFVVLGAVLCVLFAAAPFIPRRKWVWIYDIVLIGLGMTSACTLPACVPMLIFWLKPQTRAWFGYAA